MHLGSWRALASDPGAACGSRAPFVRGRATLGGSDSEGNLRARPSLNVPFPRKPPDLLMAESPPTGGLSALTGRTRPVARDAGSGQDVIDRDREALARLLEL